MIISFYSLDERESVQKKTFMKWVNSHLVRVNARIGDLYVDLRDGKQLIKLLEILSGERLVSTNACDLYVEKLVIYWTENMFVYS